MQKDLWEVFSYKSFFYYTDVKVQKYLINMSFRVVISNSQIIRNNQKNLLLFTAIYAN
jgi:hypothetical protein